MRVFGTSDDFTATHASAMPACSPSVPYHSYGTTESPRVIGVYEHRCTGEGCATRRCGAVDLWYRYAGGAGGGRWRAVPAWTSPCRSSWCFSPNGGPQAQVPRFSPHARRNRRPTKCLQVGKQLQGRAKSGAGRAVPELLCQYVGSRGRDHEKASSGAFGTNSSTRPERPLVIIIPPWPALWPQAAHQRPATRQRNRTYNIKQQQQRDPPAREQALAAAAARLSGLPPDHSFGVSVPAKRNRATGDDHLSDQAKSGKAPRRHHHHQYATREQRPHHYSRRVANQGIKSCIP